MDSLKQKAYIFGGGGFRCAGSAGAAIRAIREQGGIMPDLLGGTSGGALNAAALASKDGLRRTPQLWVDAYNNPQSIFQDGAAQLDSGKITLSMMPVIRDFIKTHGLFRSVSQALGKNPRLSEAFMNHLGLGLMKNDGLRSILEKNIDILERPLLFNFTCLEDAKNYGCEERTFLTKADLLNGLLASTAMPGVCYPVKRINFADGTSVSNCVDGGVKYIAPLKQAMDYMKLAGGEWELHFFPAHNRTLPYQKIENIGDVAARSLDMMMNQQITDDLNDCLAKNRQAAYDDSKIFVDVYLYEPGVNQYGDTLDASMILHNYTAGYQNYNPIKLS